MQTQNNTSASVLGILGGLVDLYALAGIVIMLLAYFKVLKD